MDVKSFTIDNNAIAVKDEQARADIQSLIANLASMQDEASGFIEYTVNSGAYIAGVSLKKGDVLTVKFVAYGNREEAVTDLLVYGDPGAGQGYTTLISGGVQLNGEKTATITGDFPYLRLSAWPQVPGTSPTLTAKIKIDRAENTKNLLSIGDRVASIFKKVVCIGDSYTAGYIQIESEHNYAQNPTWAWPYFAGLITGQAWLNYGISGATSISWQTNSGGLAQVRQVAGVQAYVVGLGINDILNKESLGLKLGTASDIGGDDATSFYRNMALLIEELHGICDMAKILVNTIPATESNHAIPTSQYDVASYNAAIRAIVAHYKNLGFPIHCIDLASEDNMPYYENPDVLQDYKYLHFTPIAYEQFAEIYLKILSRYILDHFSDFQDVFLIPTSS